VIVPRVDARGAATECQCGSKRLSSESERHTFRRVRFREFCHMPIFEGSP